MYGYSNGYGISPYQQQTAQNRLNQLEQQQQYGMYQQPNYTQMQQMNNMSQQMIKGRPVSSYDEAKASMIDLDGSLYVFTDIANKCIYTKQILLDGTSDFKTYILKEEKQNGYMQENKEQKEEYVLKRDFEKAMKNLNEQINGIKEAFTYDATNVDSNVKK